MYARQHWTAPQRYLLLMTLFFLTLGCSFSSNLPAFSSNPPGTPDPESRQPTTGELAQAAVQVSAMRMRAEDWVIEWSGSGVIISPDGLILTNAHVVEDSERSFESLGVSLMSRSDQAPELLYLADIVAIDYELDLAIVRIISDLDGDDVATEFPHVTLGDSDLVELGDDLRILGYPSIGGDTISYTEGVVSGFSLERGIEGRAWIKTDATIADGSSGGMGVNSDGELIGIATIVTSGSMEGSNVDCRQLADTNQDGRIDHRDTCIPVGGFINALRPVNLALPLIESVEAGHPYVGGGPPPMSPSGRYDTEQVGIGDFVFSTSVTAADQPDVVVDMVTEAVKDLYVFWDYEGMTDGMTWGLYWYRDHRYIEEASLVNRVWSGGGSGNWWAVIQSDEGLLPGLYEVVLEIEGDIWGSNAIYIGEERTRVQYEISNQSGRAICYVMLSPTLAQNWGPDDLGEREVIAPGESRVFILPAGEYDLRMMDCDLNLLAEEYNLTLDADGGYLLEDDQETNTRHLHLVCARAGCQL